MQGLENWDDLRFFLAVARAGSLAAAARELGVNQSTVLRRISQLEENLEARLFDRQPRGYALTSVGEDMVGLASNIEEDVLALGRVVAGADQELHGVIRITTVDEIMERIAPHLRCFRDRYPGIVLNINTELRLFSLSRREADVAIRPGLPPTEPDVVGRRLARLCFAAYAAPCYLEGRKRPRRLADLAKHDVIGFGEGRAQQLLEAIVGGAVPDEAIVYRANSMVGQQLAAASGLGVALLPRFMGDSHPGLKRLFAIRGEQEYGLWLLYHADLRQTARVRAFMEFIVAAIEKDRRIYE